jgi:hypothetical protein
VFSSNSLCILYTNALISVSDGSVFLDRYL